MMTIRLRLCRLLMAVGCGVLFAVAPIVTAVPAAACPIGHLSDPYTGQCYVVGGVPTVNGIPCIPGQHLGTCLGFLQNLPVPHSPQSGVGP
jgi:hypothetical protein